MQYLLLIYDDEKKWAALSHAEVGKLIAEYNQFTDDIKASKHMLGGNRLQSVTTATTVRVRDGKPQMTDGPFAETREQLGGYMLIDVKDLDEALAVAARGAVARVGAVEVRPVREGPPQ